MTKKLPVAIIIPHAGLEIPSELVGRVALMDCHIFNEADIYADLLYDFRDQVLYWLSFPYARAVLDVNRQLVESLPGDGIVKWQTSYGERVYDAGDEPPGRLEQLLIKRYWQSWHDQLAAIAADERVKLVIDAHSMAAMGPTRYSDPAQLRPRLMVANWGDEQGEIHSVRQHLTADPSLVRWWAARLGELMADVPALTPTANNFAINYPFYGGSDLLLHGGKKQPWLMVEISRALYVGHQSGDTPLTPPNLNQIQMIRERLWLGIVECLQYVLEAKA